MSDEVRVKIDTTHVERIRLLLKEVEEAAALRRDIIVIVVVHPRVKFCQVVLVILPVDLDGLFTYEMT